MFDNLALSNTSHILHILKMPTLEKYLGVVYLWNYVPNLAAAIVFTILFFLASIAHSWKMYTTRMWFCSPFAIGGFCMSGKSMVRA